MGPDTWSVYIKSIRSNNDTEGWHNSLKSVRIAPTFYETIEVLSKNSNDAEVERMMVMAGKEVRRVRRENREKEVALRELWRAYSDRKISPRTLLNKIAQLKED